VTMPEHSGLWQLTPGAAAAGATYVLGTLTGVDVA